MTPVRHYCDDPSQYISLIGIEPGVTLGTCYPLDHQGGNEAIEREVKGYIFLNISTVSTLSMMVFSDGF